MPAPGQNINEIRTKFTGAFPGLVTGLNELQELVNNIVKWILAQPGGGATPQGQGTAQILATHVNGTRSTLTVLTAVQTPPPTPPSGRGVRQNG